MAPKPLTEPSTAETYRRGLDDEFSGSPDPTPSTSRIPKLRRRRRQLLRRSNDEAALASTSRNEERQNANKLWKVRRAEQPPTKKPRRDAREVGSVNEPRGGLGLKRERVARLPKFPNPTQAQKPKQEPNPEQPPPPQKANPKPRSVDEPHARSVEGCEECQRARRSEQASPVEDASPRAPSSSSRTSPSTPSFSSTPTPSTQIKSQLEELVVSDRGQAPAAGTAAGPPFAHISPSGDWYTQQQPPGNQYTQQGSGNRYTPQPTNKYLNPPGNPYTPAAPTPSPALGYAVFEENLVPYLVLGQAGNVNVNMNVWGPPEAGNFLRPETAIFWVLCAVVAFVF